MNLQSLELVAKPGFESRQSTLHHRLSTQSCITLYSLRKPLPSLISLNSPSSPVRYSRQRRPLTAEKTGRERTGPRPDTQFETARTGTLLTWGPATRTQHQRKEPTFLLQGFKCHLPLRVVIQVTIVQDLVVQCQAAVPETFWNTRRGQAGEQEQV